MLSLPSCHRACSRTLSHTGGHTKTPPKLSSSPEFAHTPEHSIRPLASFHRTTPELTHTPELSIKSSATLMVPVNLLPWYGGRFWGRIWIYRHEISNGCHGMVSIYRHKHTIFQSFVDVESCTFSRMYKKGQGPRPLFSESVLGEVSVYIWELKIGINSLKGLAWAGKGFLND